MIKGFSKVYKSNSKISVTFVQVAVYTIKEADKEVSGGGGFHISKLLWIYGCFDLWISPVRDKVIKNEAGERCDCDWS